jgi:hypothetical protein
MDRKTGKQPLPNFFSPDPPKPPWLPIPKDLVWAGCAIGFYALHVIQVLVTACPFWTMCCIVGVPLLPFVWPMTALIVSVICLKNSFSFDKRWRLTRLVASTLCVLFLIDCVTGGDLRWFERSMRHRMNAMQIDQLQAWAQEEFSSPTRVAQWEDQKVQDLPVQFKNHLDGFRPLYRSSGAGGPSIEVGTGGWDMGWGLLVGKTDLTDPLQMGGSPGWHWVKMIKPGVYIYAFDV